MTHILRPDFTDEIRVLGTERSVQLHLTNQTGDIFIIELDDEAAGHVLEGLLYHLWNTTVEETFKPDRNPIQDSPDESTPF